MMMRMRHVVCRSRRVGRQPPQHRPRTLPNAIAEHHPITTSHGFLLPFSNSRSFSSSSSSPIPSSAPKTIGNFLLVVGCGIATYYFFPRPQKPPESHQDEHVVTNWSGTHEAKTNVYVQPESLEELEKVVARANAVKQKIRPVGSGLSPNGIGLSDAGMVNLALMDKIVDVNLETRRVTVQAGARVEQVVEALRPYGLTLQNFASIRQQQIGGFTQVGAHGTGSAIPPVDEQVVSLKLVTPAKGTLELSAENDPELFHLARLSMGTLGVVAEVTLQCVPAEKLIEYTFVTNRKEVHRRHKKWLQGNKHLRYMWIPDTDVVVVVQCNPLSSDKERLAMKTPKYSEKERLKHVQTFYKETAIKYRSIQDTKEGQTEFFSLLSDEELEDLGFTEMRDKLIAMDPLNREHIIHVNQVEAEYWKRCEGYRVGWSDAILGFDCGGQQWVSEVCFQCGSSIKPDGKDLSFMENLLNLIKEEDIPAPSPIEQRWTASSRSPLSPAFSPSGDSLFSWVGIIMYIPTLNEQQREKISSRFMEYRQATQRELWDRYGAFEHWAKIEVNVNDEENKKWMRHRLKKHFPLEALNKARKELDPNGILSNELIDELFPLSEREEI